MAYDRPAWGIEASVHRPRDASPYDAPRPVATANLNEAVLTIESFIREAGWPVRLENAWKHVKEAALKAAKTATEARLAKDHDDNDIRTINPSLRD
jgi:hypothetical protein